MAISWSAVCGVVGLVWLLPFVSASSFQGHRVRRQTFSQATYTFAPTSCAANSLVGTVTATGSGAVTYALDFGSTALFSINSNTGAITWNFTPFSAVPSVAQVFATVNGITSSTATVSINPAPSCVSGGTGTTAPTFTQASYNFAPTVCTVGGAVGTVVATGTGTVGYGIISNGQFAVNANTGALTWATAPTSATTQIVLVTASVTGGSATATTTVTVTPTATCISGSGTGTATFTQSTFSFAPTACTAGSVIGSVSATGGGTLNYGVISNGQFAINPTTGALSYAIAPTTATQQTVFVTASVAGSTTTATTTVTVTPTATCISGTGTGTGTGTLAFGQTSYALTAANCAAGSFVGTTTATSSAGATIQYFLSGGSGSYTINPTTGVITTSTGISTGTSQFTVAAVANGQSATATVTVAATCTGSGGTGGTGTGTGTTNTGSGRGAPVFNATSYTFNVNCNALPQPVGLVSASTAARDPITYGLVADSFLFFMDPSSGLISSMSVGIVAPGTYQLTATAQNPWGDRTTIPITVIESGSACTG